jgi:hypothetical protein
VAKTAVRKFSASTDDECVPAAAAQEEFYTALPCSDAEMTQEPGFIFGIRNTDAGAGDGSWRKPTGC